MWSAGLSGRGPEEQICSKLTEEGSIVGRVSVHGPIWEGT